MPRAHLLLRAEPHYRRAAFAAGLAALDYEVVYVAAGRPPRRDDVLVIWNRYGAAASAAEAFDRAGAPVIVAENGYLGQDDEGRQLYALALDGHNGAGRWPAGGAERFGTLGLTLAPWRHRGRHILICGQRGFGYNPMAMPDDWPDRVHQRLRALTRRPLWFRAHPERRRRMPAVAYDKVTDFEAPLADDLEGAWAVTVWSSNAATAALMQGYPVFYEAPHIVTAGAAQSGVEGIERPAYPDRLPVFERLAWAQWSIDEIAEGVPFKRLLAWG